MPERRKIEDKIRKKQAEVHALEDKIKAAKVYVAALQDVLKLFDHEDDAAASAESTLKAGSAVAQARDVILDRGVPVHLNDLLAALGKDVTRDSKASLTSSLAAYVRKGEIFTRPAPSTYGLAELGHDTVVEEEEAEPPENFGTESYDTLRRAPAFDDDDAPF